MEPNSAMPQVDHLIYGVLDLESGIDTIESLLGVRASVGGKHIGFGTHNALISLGPDRYLEIIAPDPDQLEYRSPRLFGLDDLTGPRLVAWVAKRDDLEQLSALELDGGLKVGEASFGSRLTPEGNTLTWQFTDPYMMLADGIVPFFINWGESPHPSRTAPQGAVLVGVRAEHPDPAHVQKVLNQLDLPLTVSKGSAPALVATINCPLGQVELR
jgi:hypothetical protein